MKKILVFLCVLLTFSLPLSAIESFVVSDIRVEGLQRISAGTVFNYLPIKVGDRIDDDTAQQSIRALYQTGFFDDVQLEQEGTVLIVVVKERPSIANIEFKGNKALDKDTLAEGMKQIGFVEGRVFDQSILDRVVQELKNQYFAQGKYGAEVETIVTPLERGRVSVTVDFRKRPPKAFQAQHRDCF
jgi:outer membrane protein insertion porin family